MKLFIITTFLFSSIFAQVAFAQDDISIQRKGFVFGTSYGTGYSILNFPNKSQNDFGFALDVKLGYMIKSDIAMLFSSNITIYDYSGFGRNRKRDFGILAPSLQYWVSDKMWVLGGFGLGGDNPVFWDIDFDNVDADPLETKYYNGLGFITAVGFEIYQRKNFTFDLKTKITYRNVELQEGKTNGLSFAILLGVNFY